MPPDFRARTLMLTTCMTAPSHCYACADRPSARPCRRQQKATRCCPYRASAMLTVDGIAMQQLHTCWPCDSRRSVERDFISLKSVTTSWHLHCPRPHEWRCSGREGWFKSSCQEADSGISEGGSCLRHPVDCKILHPCVRACLKHVACLRPAVVANSGRSLCNVLQFKLGVRV